MFTGLLVYSMNHRTTKFLAFKARELQFFQHFVVPKTWIRIFLLIKGSICYNTTKFESIQVLVIIYILR